jgi:hypothetical protein
MPVRSSFNPALILAATVALWQVPAHGAEETLVSCPLLWPPYEFQRGPYTIEIGPGKLNSAKWDANRGVFECRYTSSDETPLTLSQRLDRICRIEPVSTTNSAVQDNVCTVRPEANGLHRGECVLICR